MHWKHSRFQIVYTILGNCHTVDEAYRVLCELEEDRSFSIESSLAESLRSQSKVVGAKKILEDKEETKANILLAQCFVDETKARKKIAQPCLDEARREIAFIQELKKKLDPHRKYRHLEFHAANQACQVDEFLLDLVWKAYNHLCSTGHIPHDHFMLIKMHPKQEQIMNEVGRMISAMQSDPQTFMLKTKRDILQPLDCSNMLHTSNLSVDTSGAIEYVHDIPKRIEQVS